MCVKKVVVILVGLIISLSFIQPAIAQPASKEAFKIIGFYLDKIAFFVTIVCGTILGPDIIKFLVGVLINLMKYPVAILVEILNICGICLPEVIRFFVGIPSVALVEILNICGICLPEVVEGLKEIGGFLITALKWLPILKTIGEFWDGAKYLLSFFHTVTGWDLKKILMLPMDFLVTCLNIAPITDTIGDFWKGLLSVDGFIQVLLTPLNCLITAIQIPPLKNIAMSLYQGLFNILGIIPSGIAWDLIKLCSIDLLFSICFYCISVNIFGLIPSGAECNRWFG